jgi:hypothetical protein
MEVYLNSMKWVMAFMVLKQLLNIGRKDATNLTPIQGWHCGNTS